MGDAVLVRRSRYRRRGAIRLRGTAAGEWRAAVALLDEIGSVPGLAYDLERTAFHLARLIAARDAAEGERWDELAAQFEARTEALRRLALARRVRRAIDGCPIGDTEVPDDPLDAVITGLIRSET